jgi:hypothetical protein
MVGIIFDNLPIHDGFKHIIKCDIFLGHFLLCMLRDTHVLCRSLRLYPGEYRPEIIRVMHSAAQAGRGRLSAKALA